MTVRQATKGRTQERNARSSSSTRLLMSRSQSLSNALGSSSVAGTRPRSNRTGRGAGLVATSESGLAAASVVAVVAASCARHLRIGRGVNNIGRMVCPPPGKLVWCLSREGVGSGRRPSSSLWAGRSFVGRNDVGRHVVIGRNVARSQPSYASYTTPQTTRHYGEACMVPSRVGTSPVLVIVDREVVRRSKRCGSSLEDM